MIGAGTFINPLIKIVTTVAILAAIYFFFVKPALDTSEDISNSVNESVGRAFDQSDNLSKSIQKSIDSSIPPEARRAQKRGACITKAGGDVDKINACNEKFPF